GCATKNHCGVNFCREDHGIVALTAGHPVRLTTSASNGLFDLIGQELVHGDRSLIEKRSPLQGSTARGGNCFGLPYQIIPRLGADVVGSVTKIQSRACFTRDDVCRSGFCFYEADGGHQARDATSYVL